MIRTGAIAGWIEALAQDLRYAARGLCKRPAFTLVAVLTLALGIGGITTIFTAIDVLLLRPFLVSSLLIAVTFLASYIPARHATAIDPMQTLRHD